MKHIKYFKETYEFHNKRRIVDSYLETALWSEEDKEELQGKSIYDFSDKAREQAEEEIEWFISNADDALNDIDNESIGHDLWLSRNGHGAGFFDRGYDDDVEEILEHLSDVLGTIYIEVNESDKIVFYGGSDKYKEFDIDEYNRGKEFNNAVKKYNV